MCGKIIIVLTSCRVHRYEVEIDNAFSSVVLDGNLLMYDLILIQNYGAVVALCVVWYCYKCLN